MSAHPNHGARVRYLGAQLGDVLAWLNASEDPTEQEAAADLDRALDRIDSAVTMLRTDEAGNYDEDADDPTCGHGLCSKGYICDSCGETFPLEQAEPDRARFAVAFAEWQAEREELSAQEATDNPPGDKWHGSDDAAVDLLQVAASIISRPPA